MTDEHARDRVGVRELRQNLSVYLRRVKTGEALEVTERGHVVARLVPAREDESVLERPIDEVLRTVTVVAIDDDVLLAAAELEPAQLRTLDAIHLATALRVEQELDGFITYDRRLGDAAVRAGLSVEAPADRA